MTKIQRTCVFGIVWVLCTHALAPVPQRGHGQGKGRLHVGLGGGGARLDVRSAFASSLPSFAQRARGDVVIWQMTAQ